MKKFEVFTTMSIPNITQHQNNINVLVNFPNNDNAQISLNGEGSLTNTNRGWASWSASWVRNTTWISGEALKNTIALVDITCRKEFEALNSDYQDRMALSKALLEGLKNIENVYNRRCKATESEVMKTLSTLTQHAQSEIQRHEIQVGQLQQAAQERAEAPQKEIKDKLGMSFIDVDENSIPADLAIENLPSSQSLFAKGDGTGPNNLGKIYSVLRTGRLLTQNATSHWLRTSQEPTQQRSISPAQKNRLENNGKMLGGTIVETFLKGLRQEYNFTAIPDFYLARGISDYTLEEVKNGLQQHLADNPTEPIVIPVVLDGGNFFESAHIATILVADNKIEYFDPKGVFSEYQQLADGHSLRDVLNYINQSIYGGKGEIHQNAAMHQFDSNNCGVFACYIIDHRMKNRNLGHYFQKQISLKTICDFRQEILRVGFPEANSDEECSSYDRKDTDFNLEDPDFDEL